MHLNFYSITFDYLYLKLLFFFSLRMSHSDIHSFSYWTTARRHCFFVVTSIAPVSYTLLSFSSAVIPELLERGYRIYVTFLVNHSAISSSLHLGHLWSMCCSSSTTNINPFCSIEMIEFHEALSINFGLNACTIGILTEEDTRRLKALLYSYASRINIVALSILS